MLKFSSFATLAATLAALGLAGCSTATLKQRPFSDAPWSGTALLINYNLVNGDGSPVTDDCQLVLAVQGLGDRSVDLPAGTDRALVDAPAGTYTWKSISCSHFTRWELNALSNASFTAVAGKINFVGRITFRFPKQGQDVLDADIGAQASATTSLAIELQSLPAPWASAMENPYTDKPITRAMLAPKGIYRMQLHFSQQLEHGAKSVSTRALKRSLNACDQAEQKRFPYRIGSLDDTAEYSGGKLQKLTRSGENSFSDEFLSCVEGALRGFVPSAGVQLKARVLL